MREITIKKKRQQVIFSLILGLFYIFTPGFLVGSPAIHIKSVNTDNYPLLRVRVSVPERPGRGSGKGPGQFTVQESYQKKGSWTVSATAPVRVKSEVGGLNLVLILDSTKSVPQKDFDRSVRAALQIIGHLKPGEQAAIHSLNGKSNIKIGFTSDKARLRTVLRNMRRRGQTTKVYDALYNGISMARDRVTHLRGMKTAKMTGHAPVVVLVLTDGQDEGSFFRPKDCESFALGSPGGALPLHTVLYGKPYDSRVYRGMAGRTGGSVSRGLHPNKLLSLMQRLRGRSRRLYEFTIQSQAVEKALVAPGKSVNLLIDYYPAEARQGYPPLTATVPYVMPWKGFALAYMKLPQFWYIAAGAALLLILIIIAIIVMVLKGSSKRRREMADIRENSRAFHNLQRQSNYENEIEGKPRIYEEPFPDLQAPPAAADQVDYEDDNLDIIEDLDEEEANPEPPPTVPAMPARAMPPQSPAYAVQAPPVYAAPPQPPPPPPPPEGQEYYQPAPGYDEFLETEGEYGTPRRVGRHQLHMKAYSHQMLQNALREGIEYHNAGLYLQDARRRENRKEYDLFLDVTVVGSGRWANIHLNDRSVSPVHAKIKRVDGKFVIYDLVSGAGVYLNGKKLLRPRCLVDGDELKIGRSYFAFRGNPG